MYTRVDAHIHAHAWASMHMCMCTYVHEPYADTHVLHNTHTPALVYTHVDSHIHTCMGKHTHVHMYTCASAGKLGIAARGAVSR